MKKKIGFFVGSLRKGSYNKQIARAFASLFPDEYEPVFVDLHDLVIYNQDLDDDGIPPKAWTDFRNEVSELSGLVFVTPEYNRSVPAVLKNALDIGSRPYGANVWDGKPGLVISVSPGSLSGFGANHHLRQSLVFLNVPTLQQPEAYIGNVTDLINNDDSIAEDSMKFFDTIVKSYLSFLEKNR